MLLNCRQVQVMREFVAKTRKVGDCIVVVLPKELLQAEQLRENMDVKVLVTKLQRNGQFTPSKNDICPVDDPWRLLE